MTPENFVYWLQGYFEVNRSEKFLTEEQFKVVQDHLKTVFHKVTPVYTTKDSSLPLQVKTYETDPRHNNDPFNNAQRMVC